MSTGEFYLASSEGYGMESPRRCVSVRRLSGEDRDDYLLVDIDPPIVGQQFGMVDDIHQVIVATRHKGDSLFPIQRWPVFVHVARLLVPYRGQDVVQNKELQTIAWAELYESAQAAESKEL